MDELDRQLDQAWNTRLARGDPKPDSRLCSTLSRPLRSWALVLRANDARLEETCPIMVTDYMEWPCDPDGPECAVEAVRLTKDTVRQLVKLITIPWPGIPIDAAARQCGVNQTTIHRWTKKGRLVMDKYVKRDGTNLHRADKRVWTRWPIDTNSDVWCHDWNVDPEALANRLPGDDDWTQDLVRSHRCLGRKSVCRFFKCPTCPEGPNFRGWVYKLFMPMGIWTMPMALGIDDPRRVRCADREERQNQDHPVRTADPTANTHIGATFTCHRCAKLIYESAERTSRPAPGRTVDAWDRFIRRLSGDRLRGREVNTCGPTPPPALGWLKTR